MELGKYIEHTNLSIDATMKDIEKLCNEAISYHFETVCVHPYYVTLASSLLKGTNIGVTCVVGYPLGMNSTSTKAYEAIEAVNNGADEINMVINIAALKNKDYDYIKEEVEEIRDSIDGKVLKILVNTTDLENEEIIKLVEICNDTYVNYITLFQASEKENIKMEDISLIQENKNDILEISVNCEDKDLLFINKLVDSNISRIGINNGVKLMEIKDE